MATTVPSAKPILRFGVFELDQQTGELRKFGRKVRLRPQAARVLSVLLTQPGQLITRERLKEEIWGQETFVDFEHGLNFCIRQIREALGDDADSPRYVETLPRRGYRFIAPLNGSIVGQPDVRSRPQQQKRRGLVLAGAIFMFVFVLLAAFSISRLVKVPKIPVDPSTWVQITNLSDSVSQPALSPDGRMLTFVRGPDTFAAQSQIYVKVLSDGEPIQLTRDNSAKMSPAFSPDDSEIAYTSLAIETWDTWVVSVINGQPRLWLPNASGLVWSKKGRVLFSEIKDHDLHMGIVTARDDRAEERDVYLPAGDRGMAHRSYPAPDGKSVLVVEMDRGIWLPCRLVLMDGSSPGRPVGPSKGGCTSAAWSPDGRWMYLSSSSGGAFHIWRQRFPDGQPEQITAGPTEEEGIAMASDGRSLITAVGLRKSAVWLHDSTGERQVSSEGYSYDPEFTRDGKTLCYRVLKGALPWVDPTELRIVNLNSSRDEPLLPGLAISGLMDAGYDISPDGKEVVVSALDEQGRRGLWLASLDRRSPPRQITSLEAQQPKFGPGGKVFFLASEVGSPFVYEVREDGTGLRKVLKQPIVRLVGVSRDGRWLLVKRPRKEGRDYAALSLVNGSSIPILSNEGEVDLRWSPDGRLFFISLPTAALASSGHTYVLPLPNGQIFPRIPPGGFASEGEIARLAGARLINAYDTSVGQSPEVYAFARETVQRNLFRVPLP